MTSAGLLYWGLLPRDERMKAYVEALMDALGARQSGRGWLKSAACGAGFYSPKGDLPMAACGAGWHLPEAAGLHLPLAARVGDYQEGDCDAVLPARDSVWAVGDLLCGGAAYGGGYYLLYVLPEEVSGD